MLQYHFHRIFWQNPEQQIILGDMDVNHTSVVSPARATIFLLRHHSLHPYPGKAPKSGHLINKAHWLPLWGTAIDCTMKEYSTGQYAKCEKISVKCQKASCKKTMYKNGIRTSILLITNELPLNTEPYVLASKNDSLYIEHVLRLIMDNYGYSLIHYCISTAVE